jgi:hypothetical protein
MRNEYLDYLIHLDIWRPHIPFDQGRQVVKVTAVCCHVDREAAAGLGCSETGVMLVWTMILARHDGSDV